MAGDDLLPLWRLNGMTGMRRGEVCGLLLGDVNLDAAQLRVRRQLGVIEPLEFRERPKSDHGQCTIDLDAETVRIFRRHRATQPERRPLVGGGWQDNALMFLRPAGEPLHSPGPSTAEPRRPACHTSAFTTHSKSAHLIAAGTRRRSVGASDTPR